jgi:hypothetical protein
MVAILALFSRLTRRVGCAFELLVNMVNDYGLYPCTFFATYPLGLAVLKGTMSNEINIKCTKIDDKHVMVCTSYFSDLPARVGCF